LNVAEALGLNCFVHAIKHSSFDGGWLSDVIIGVKSSSNVTQGIDAEDLARCQVFVSVFHVHVVKFRLIISILQGHLKADYEAIRGS
jgi:hypothetical protein